MFNMIENSIDEITITDFFDKIATVAHNCYQVKDKDHESNIAFVKRLIESRHLAMVEHYSFTFKVDEETYLGLMNTHNRFYELRDFYCEKCEKHAYLVNTSLRALLESYDRKDTAEYELYLVLIRALPSEVQALFEVTEGKSAKLFDLDAHKDRLPKEIYDEFKKVTYHIITDRGVTHELVRHRIASYAQESTRYCNYTKDKFSSSLTFMKPLKYDEFKEVYDEFYESCTKAYFALINGGARPDEARSVLPNSLKTSIMVTASLNEWKKIFELRTDDHAHADIRRVMNLVKDDMKEKHYL